MKYLFCDLRVFGRTSLSAKTSYLNGGAVTSFLPDNAMQWSDKSVGQIPRMSAYEGRTKIIREKKIELNWIFFHTSRPIHVVEDNFWEIGPMKITSNFAFLGMLRNARAAATAIIITEWCYIRRAPLCHSTSYVCLSVRLWLSGAVMT